MGESYFAEALSVRSGKELRFSAEVEIGHEEDFLKPVSDVENRTFDLASLTKVILTSTLAVDCAQEDGAMDLLEWAGSQFPLYELGYFRGQNLEEVALVELWEHWSGLSANIDLEPSRPYFYRLEKRPEAWRSVLEQISFVGEKLEGRGETLYSDVGFLIFGAWLEHKARRRLDWLWEDWQRRHQIKKELPFFHLNNEVKSPSSVLPTEQRHGVGEVNDDKAYFLGGVAPHAGLFGGVREVQNYIEHILSLRSTHTLWNQWLHREAQGRFVLGWDTPSGKVDSHAGASAPDRVRGHLGYTGTALWIDPAQHSYGILLSNRVCPQSTEKNKKSIQKLRSAFFDSLWRDTL